jgi:hypothetical protein
MAKIKSNGAIIGDIVAISGTKRYMSNGWILKNTGHGWKRHGKLQEGLCPLDCFERAERKQTLLLASRPCLAAWRKAFLACGPLSKRWNLLLAMDMMGDDIDGIWSTVCDGYSDQLDLSVDDIGELSRLRAAAIAEGKAAKENQE